MTRRNLWTFVLSLCLLVGGLIAWLLFTTTETFPASSTWPGMTVTTYHKTVPSLMLIAGVVLLAISTFRALRNRS